MLYLMILSVDRNTQRRMLGCE